MGARCSAGLVVRCGLAIAAVSWVAEGYLERRTVVRAFVERESVPGESKIIEHFALQHVVFPALAMGLALAPVSTRRALVSAPGVLPALVGISAVLCIPETRVSLPGGGSPGDLFRRYPFDLPAPARSIEMIHLGGLDVNVLQFLHLGLNHYLFTTVLATTWIHRRAVSQRWRSRAAPTTARLAGPTAARQGRH